MLSGYTQLEEDYNDVQYRRRALTLMSVSTAITSPPSPVRALTMAQVDDIVGNITEFLDSKGMLDNTYIFYSSDHGTAWRWRGMAMPAIRVVGC